MPDPLLEKVNQLALTVLDLLVRAAPAMDDERLSSLADAIVRLEGALYPELTPVPALDPMPDPLGDLLPMWSEAPRGAFGWSVDRHGRAAWHTFDLDDDGSFKARAVVIVLCGRRVELPPGVAWYETFRPNPQGVHR